MGRLRWLSAILIAAVFAPVALLAQQPATVSGRVTSANGEPQQAVLIRINALNIGTTSAADGTYRLVIPGNRIRTGQSVDVTASRQGLASATRTVTVSPGSELTQNFQLSQRSIALDEVVATGVAAPTAAVRVPFSVAKVTAEDLPVPSVNAAGAIQGKVAGARVIQGSGEPGSAPSILLRAPTSINAQGRSQEPLYIVDGVILGSSPQDIASEDIESVEVVKGAAAASLYGSRAGNGVIQITTKRGRDLSGRNRTRYTFRSEYGVNDIEGSLELSRLHSFQLTPDGSAFLGIDNVTGDTVAVAYNDLSAALIPMNTNPNKTFQVNPYPGQQFNHIERFFDPGDFKTLYGSVEGASGKMNFFASGSFLDQTGVLRADNGYQRQSYRLNVDHGLGERISLSASAAYTVSDRDVVDTDGSGSPFFNLTFIPPTVDLGVRDSTGSLDPTGDVREPTEYPNPLYEVENRQTTENTSRILGSLQGRFAPASWFDLEGAVSYDRTDYQYRDFYPKGYLTKSPSAALNNGRLVRQNYDQDAFNGSMTASFYKQFGDLNTTTRARYLTEQSNYREFNTGGSRFVVKGVPDLNALQDNIFLGSTETSIRAEGYFLITALDYKDRYILDGLVRRDGSSLFGSDERWQTYYRGSAAWRVSEEPWFNVGPVNELKLRYSVGTAGGRPNFYAQYESYSISGNSVTPDQLGNTQLKPEFVTEHEMGIDMGLFDRLTLNLTYARATADDQILRVPLPAATGFSSQWQNAGQLKSNTIEATLEAQLLRNDNINWTGRFIFDRTRQKITQLDVPCFQTGDDDLQNVEGVFYNCEGLALGSFFGRRWATSCADLPEAAQGSCSQFQRNDDGYLVYVGAGNSYTEGQTKNLWGTSATVEGTSYAWGQAFASTGIDQWTGQPTQYLFLGSTTPDYNVSLSSNFDWRGLSLYGLLDASRGFNVYNQTRQWAMFRNRAGETDQIGKAPGDLKPVAYYSNLYNQANINSHFVEDGSFVKLREVALRYTLNQDRIRALRVGGLDHVTLGLIGRNLKTWTDYRGFDPEVGRAASAASRATGGNEGGSAAISRFDAFGYPNYRTLTFQVELGF